MTSTRTDLAALVLRLTLGTVLLAHGLLKLLVFTLPGTAGFFASVGFPAWTAYPVVAFEVLGGLAMIAGWQTTWVAIAAIPVMLGAVTVHAANGWLFSAKNGGWEFPAVLALLAVVVALLGEGAYSLQAALRRAPTRTLGTAAA